MKKTLLLTACMLLSLAASAITYPSSSYEISSGKLVKWTGPEEEIDFTADSYLLENVDEIGEYAFENNATLKKVTLSSTITYVSIYAFKGCQALETVVFSESGNHDELYNIDNEAFRDCKNLTSVTFSKYVTGIEGDAFRGCSSLTTYKITSGHPTWKSSGGIIYTSDYTKIVMFPPGITGHHDLNSKVTSIGDYAFYGSSLTTIYLESEVETIGKYAFGRAESLTTINFPASLSSIGKYAFYKCASLKSLILPSSLCEIGACAFRQCTSLPETIKLPASLQSIYGSAFSECTQVKGFEVASGNPYFATNDGVLYDISFSKLVCYPAGKSNKFVIPEGVTSIGPGAFYYSSISDLTFPSTLTSVEENAFVYSFIKKVELPEGFLTLEDDAFSFCDSLTEIILPSTIQSFNEYAFVLFNAEHAQRTVTCKAPSPIGEWRDDEVANDILYVPEESIDLYKMAKYWRSFGQILPIPEKKSYTITYNDSDCGLIIVAVDGNEIASGTAAEEGSEVTVLVVPFTNYIVKSITVNGAEIENNSTFTLTSDVVINAVFVDKSTGINDINSPSLTGIYNLDGVRLNKMFKGVNIIRSADGKVRKVLQK